jgi:hypothetical protein
LIEDNFVSVHLVSFSIERIFQLIKAFNVLGDNHIISIGVYDSFSNSSCTSSFSLLISSFTFEINCHSTCKDFSLNIEKYEVSISQENFIASTGVIAPFVVTTISRESRLVISPNLVCSILYLTFSTGEKLASICNISTSSSSSFSSSTVKYQTHFSTLISIFSSKPS